MGDLLYFPNRCQDIVVYTRIWMCATFQMKEYSYGDSQFDRFFFNNIYFNFNKWNLNMIVFWYVL